MNKLFISLMLAVALKGQCCIIGIPFNDVTKKEKNIKFLSMESKDILIPQTCARQVLYKTAKIW